MPINKETIISVFDDKLTLMQWLKTINKALEDAVLTGVEITKKGNATLSFKFTFEDGTSLETNDLVLQQGESVENAYIQNGHLYLTLTNGTNLDAGNVKPVSNFSIDANQHLIVNYADGTSQDLGAIFQGNVNIDGTLNATKVTGNEIVENMNGYAFDPYQLDLPYNPIYASSCKNGNKLTFVVFGSFTLAQETTQYSNMGYFTIPNSVGAKLYPFTIGIEEDVLDSKKITLVDANGAYVGNQIVANVNKETNERIWFKLKFDHTPAGTYLFRHEVTFLLSDNLAQ